MFVYSSSMPSEFTMNKLKPSAFRLNKLMLSAFSPSAFKTNKFRSSVFKPSVFKRIGSVGKEKEWAIEWLGVSILSIVTYHRKMKVQLRVCQWGFC